jgi:hypothetical protein
MSKKIIFVLVILTIAAGVVSAQDDDRAKNSVAVHLGFIGIAASYERIFIPQFSLLAEVSYTTLILMDEFTASVKARWYPFGKTFFMDLGLGYSFGYGATGFVVDAVRSILTLGLWLAIKPGGWEHNEFRTGGFLVQPGLGWKIDIGRPDGFILPVSLGLDFKLGKVPDMMPYIRIGLGYSF